MVGCRIIKNNTPVELTWATARHSAKVLHNSTYYVLIFSLISKTVFCVVKFSAMPGICTWSWDKICVVESSESSLVPRLHPLRCILAREGAWSLISRERSLISKWINERRLDKPHTHDFGQYLSRAGVVPAIVDGGLSIQWSDAGCEWKRNRTCSVQIPRVGLRSTVKAGC